MKVDECTFRDMMNSDKGIYGKKQFTKIYLYIYFNLLFD